MSALRSAKPARHHRVRAVRTPGSAAAPWWTDRAAGWSALSAATPAAKLTAASAATLTSASASISTSASTGATSATAPAATPSATRTADSAAVPGAGSPFQPPRPVGTGVRLWAARGWLDVRRLAAFGHLACCLVAFATAEPLVGP